MQQKKTETIQSSVINEAINYIFSHMDEEITVDDVAQHCGYSKYHLSRMFKEHTDEAIYQFIKRVRLERSAWRLKVEKQKSVTEIGEDYGYSASNFAAAFKKHLNVSPAAFRKISEQWVEESTFAHGMHLGELESEGKKITVEYLGAYTVICERKKGNYHNLARQWCEFIEKYAEYADENTLYLECTIDDPSITDEDHCMYELCQTISPEHPAAGENLDGFIQTFEGGKYAVYHFKGYPQFLFMVYQEIFCRWLTKTGNCLDERRFLDIYRYVREDGYMEIDICFPLK